MSKDILLSEIADMVVLKKDEVIDKLNHAGIPTDSSVSEAEVADVVVDNLGNKKLIHGLATIVAKKEGEYETFLNANGNKNRKRPSEPQDYNSEIASYFYGIETNDKPTLKDKVENLRREFGTEVKQVASGWKILILLGLGAAALYVITLPAKKG